MTEKGVCMHTILHKPAQPVHPYSTSSRLHVCISLLPRFVLLHFGQYCTKVSIWFEGHSTGLNCTTHNDWEVWAGQDYRALCVPSQRTRKGKQLVMVNLYNTHTHCISVALPKYTITCISSIGCKVKSQWPTWDTVIAWHSGCCVCRQPGQSGNWRFYWTALCHQKVPLLYGN